MTVPYFTSSWLYTKLQTYPYKYCFQAAVYGLGVCAEHGGSVIKPLIGGKVLSRLNFVIRQPDALELDNVMAYDNAVSALGKVCHFHRDSIDSAQVSNRTPGPQQSISA
ncbi:putative armadillo-like helical, importin beta family [Helianthus anomalus]